jgi:hypothetical protein
MHFIRPQDDYAASLRDEIYEQLNEAERSMLGFEVVQEYCGRLFPRNPNDHRHNTNARYPYIPELRRGDAQHAAPFVNMGSNET